MKKMMGVTNQELNVWLQKSKVFLTNALDNPESSASTALAELHSCVKVIDMGLFKFLIKFESKEAANEALRNKKEALSFGSQNVECGQKINHLKPHISGLI